MSFTDTTGATVTGVYAADVSDPITANERLVATVGQLVVSFSEDLNVTGGSSGVNSATNAANWKLLRNGVDISSQISDISFVFNNTTNRYEAILSLSTSLTGGDYSLTALSAITDLNGNALDGDGNGTPGGDFSQVFSIRTPVAQGSEFRVNTTTASTQYASTVAMDADGDFVVTWGSFGPDIYAQRYDSAGVAVGSEFRVNTTTASYQSNSSVAMDADGDFVVTWTSYLQDGSHYGIYAQRYNSAGVAVGSEFRVNTTTASTQRDSTVAMDADGDFVVTWSSAGQDGRGYGIYAQRYNSSGVAVGSEFRINTTTASEEFSSTVAMDADGDFVVTWTSFGPDGSGYGIYAQRYNSAGAAVGGEFRVNTTTANDQHYSTVAMDADGDFVVTWSSNLQDGSGWGIYAQRYNSSGVAVGGEFRVNTTTANDQHYSTVAMDADGDFVVTWSSNLQDGDGYGIYAQRYNSAGVAQGGEVLINSYTASTQRYSTVAMDADGDFVVDWQSNGIYAQVYKSTEAPATVGINNVSVFRDAPNTTIDLFAAFADSTDPDSNLTYSVVSNSQPSLFSGTTIDNSTGQLILDYNPNSFGSGNITLRATDTSGLFVETTFSVSVGSFASNGSEFGVNTTTANQQRSSTVAMDADGDFVVTWSSSGQDGGGYGIYAQRYNSAGVAVGSEFGVNTTTASTQYGSTVAMDADGDFVVTWNSYGQDGSGYGIYAQRYNSAGAAVGSEFRVNTTTASTQRYSTVAMDADGDFVVTWTSSGQDGSGDGIYAQRYNSAGVAVGGEFRVNTTTASTQRYSTVAMDADGDFVVTWTSSGQDGDGDGIYAQRYNSSGVAVGGEFLVNTTTNDYQYASTVAMDADGDFVVTWNSYGQDGSGYGIYAQRYNSSGVAVGGEFLVNTTTNDYQYASTVAMDADGDFIVTWNSYGQDGNGYGIYAQRYNSAGVAMGGEVLINSYTSDDQYGSSVAMDADGDFVVGWQSNGQDGSGYGIYAQSFDGNQIPTTTGINNVIVAEDAANTVIDLFAAFADNDADNTLSYSITGNTTSSLFSSTTIDQVTGQLVLDYANNANGSSDLTVRATDSRGLYTETTFNVNVTAVNDAPVLTTNNSLTLNERTDSTITNALLQTTDVEQTNEQLIYTLTDLPNYGTLQLNDGVNNVPLAVGQTFTQADINSGKVSYNHNGAETASDSFAFTVKDGAGGFISTRTFSINISAVDETINGTSGNDTINGLAGNDTINGLAGNDTINGGSGNDTINGGSGNDTLNGSSGNDTYIVDSSSDSISEIANEGIDTVQSAVSWTLGANLENLTLTGAAAINGTGNTLNNTLTGNAGANILDGGTGSDSLIGGLGNDTYIVNVATDVITEAAGAGTDSVQSAVSWTLGANLENLTLTGAAAINGTGNTLNNTLTGNAGANILDGGTGSDSLIGGLGNDTYIVNVATDVITEAAGAGTDSVQSAVSWTLGANLENLTLTGAAAINGTGNTLNNTLTGNAGANILDGGTGSDSLIGGLGNDTYIVNVATDVITEAAGAGTDSVQSAVSWTLGANLENLTLTGAAAINGTGNTLNNTLTGNAGANILDGGTGSDSLIGGLGNDTYIVNVATDVITEAAGAGTDSVQSAVSWTLGANLENLTLTGAAAINGTGNTLNNTLTGNAGANILDGGTGSDSLIGGLGNDTYIVNVATDVITEAAGAGTDSVQSAVSWTLGANLENLTLTGAAAINGTGNTLNNTLTGNAGANILDGGTGSDSLIGGLGNDTYIVNVATDVITEAAGAGTDSVQSAVSWTLGANLENLTLTGAAAINGTGNTLNNTLTGNAGANILDGGTGSDSLIGGLGNDTYIVNVATDVITEAAGAGTDSVQSAVSWTLGANLENLTLTGAAAINGTGNTLNNTLTGNAAANTLTGAEGIDTLTGLGGNDILVGGFGNDTLTGGTGADSFRFNAPTEGIDKIADFKLLDNDILQISAAGFGGGLAIGTLTSEMYLSGSGATTATNATQRFIYNSTNGGLFFDADGNGAGSATIQIATLSGLPALNNSNIAIIA